jgi:hypothetical protein
MSNALKDFLAAAIPRAKDDLITAFNRLPDDKRDWSPMGTARTALDQMAEVALLNGATADVIAAKKWTMGDDFTAYMNEKAELSKDPAACIKLLESNTQKVVAAIADLADGDFAISLDAPWGPMTLAQSASYPYWNACYHEGQINYIASMLGCLD